MVWVTAVLSGNLASSKTSPASRRRTRSEPSVHPHCDVVHSMLRLQQTVTPNFRSPQKKTLPIVDTDDPSGDPRQLSSFKRTNGIYVSRRKKRGCLMCACDQWAHTHA